MPYNQTTAKRIKDYLTSLPQINLEEKKMFGGLAFMVNGKMCINASGNNLMCRFDPLLQEKIEKKKGYLPMIMKGKKLAGYCYVQPGGFETKKDFEFWVNLCLDYNAEARSSK